MLYACGNACRPYPECCHVESCGGVWHHPYRDPKDDESNTLVPEHLKKVKIHTLPPLPRPDMSSLCCIGVVDLLGRVS